MIARRCKNLVFIMLIVVMMTLPTLAQTAPYFYGELDQWDKIVADSIASGGLQLQTLKAVAGPDALYIYLEQQDPNAEGTIYITTGQDPYGYLGRGLWAEDPTIDFKIEEGILYSYDGGGFDETWRQKGTVESVVADGAVITKVDGALLRLNTARELAVSYHLTGRDYLPGFGQPMLKVNTNRSATEDKPLAKSFWRSIRGQTPDQASHLELKAVRDFAKLFVLVNGTELNPKNTYYLSTGAEKGFTDLPWLGETANYKVENGILFAYDLSAATPRWKQIEHVYTYITADSVVMAVDLSLLEADAETPIKIGYVNNKEHFLPDTEMFFVNAFVDQPIMANTFYPTEYYGVLNNPFKGWAPSALYGPYNQPHRLVHAYITWRELEPERGVFDWEALEKKNSFDAWFNKGVRIITRINLDYPTDNPNIIEIPDWLYEMIDGDGTWYQTSEIGSGFSPNYANPILIAEHERMIKAFGERYNNDPRIAFIQLGSIGHWGEWHTWPSGSGVFPEEPVANQYIQHYVDALDQKMLGIRRPLAHARLNNFGYFNDRIGHEPTTEQWMFWINNGMDYDNWYNRRVYPEAAVPDFWHTAYSAGEFGSGNALLWLRDETVSDTLRQVRISHTSWAGPCSPAGVGNVPDLVNINTVLNTMGYHFVVETVTHEPTAVAGEELAINMVWNNKGVAPFYFEWPLEIGLINAEDELVFTAIVDEDIRSWLPGRHSVDLGLAIEQTLPAGTYRLVTAILNPETGKPGVDLGIKGRRDDGRYVLSTVTISK